MKRGFEPREEKAIYDALVAQLPNHPVALGVLIRLFIALTVGETAALCWGDIYRITGERRHLYIYKELRRGMQEPTLLQNESKFRQVPIPLQLDHLIQKQSQWLMAETDLSEVELKACPLLCHPRNPKVYLPVSAMEKAARQAVESASIPAHMVKIPGQGRKMTDLSKYGGDIFRENLRYRAVSYCEMTEAELAYLFGQVLPDTYSKHYCDFTNPFIQLQLCRKLERWWIRYDETLESHCQPRRMEGMLTPGRKKSLVLEKPNMERAGTQIILHTDYEENLDIHLHISAPGGMELRICS